jgi:hypothetical protein
MGLTKRPLEERVEEIHGGSGKITPCKLLYFFLDNNYFRVVHLNHFLRQQCSQFVCNKYASAERSVLHIKTSKMDVALSL